MTNPSEPSDVQPVVEPMPERLPSRPISHYYRGGENIAKLRRITLDSDHQPEEWIGSTVSRFDDDKLGLTVLEDGSLLRDAVAADPQSWTGQSRTGSDVGVLVKLLDAGQRLPVHVHPDRKFAASHLDCPYGKSEAWYVISALPGSAVYVGWNTDLDPAELAQKRDEQDTEWLLAHMNRIEVSAGMGVYVPAGTAHAIGEGVFVAEVQEPTDFSILLEWSVTTSTRDESHLDLGFDRAMGAVSHRALPLDELEKLVVHTENLRVSGAQSLYPADADPFFQLTEVYAAPGERATVNGGVPAYSVLIFVGGSGQLESGSGSGSGGRGSEAERFETAGSEASGVNTAVSIEVNAGEAWAVPHSFGGFEIVAAACGDTAVDADAAAGRDEGLRVLVATAGSTWPPA